MSHEGTEKRDQPTPEGAPLGGAEVVLANLERGRDNARADGEGSGKPSDVGIPATNFTFDAINERLVRAGLKPFTREELRKEAK